MATKWPLDKMQEVIIKYSSGKTLKALGKEYHVSAPMIRYILERGRRILRHPQHRMGNSKLPFYAWHYIMTRERTDMKALPKYEYRMECTSELSEALIMYGHALHEVSRHMQEELKTRRADKLEIDDWLDWEMDNVVWIRKRLSLIEKKKHEQEFTVE